jgi:pimeloyl-ACP methyl ester carboxylesterase
VAKLVLVHGAWHGPWCFERVIPLLRAAGHEVAAPDLPVAARAMADWVAPVLEAIGTGPAVLLGHSRGGAVISAVAEAAPEKLSRLIYLSGFLLRRGQSVLAAAQEDILLPIVMDQESRACTLVAADAAARFYTGCSAEDVAFALARLRPEPLFGLTAPLRVTPERFGIVPRDYIECTRDQVISLAAQRRMQAAWPVQGVRTLDTGHSPFLSDPETLAAAVTALLNGGNALVSR